MNKRRKFFIKLIVISLLLTAFVLSLPRFPKPGESLDFKELGKNFWVQLYLSVLPAPLPGYHSLMVKDTLWKKEKSPRRVKANLFIAHGVTLTIEPGATILLDNDVRITCMGRMVAEGTKEAPIVFASRNQGEFWKTIECGYGSMDKDTAPVHIFRYCEFKGGGELTFRDSRAEVDQCEFHDNTSSSIRFEYAGGRITNNRVYKNSTEREAAYGNGAGIMVYTDREVIVKNNEVYDNRSMGGRDGGGGIYAFAYDHGKVSVVENTIRNNYSDRHGGGMVAYACLIEKNRVINNKAEMSGGGIYAISSQVINNQVEENHAGKGGGIYADYSLVRGNLIDGNSAPPASGSGLYYLGDGLIENNTLTRNHGEKAAQSDTIMVSGGPRIYHNNIVTQGGYALRIDSHSLSPDVDAKENFWGTGDPRSIEALVFDWCDKSDVGMVNWDDFSLVTVKEAPRLPNGVKDSVTQVAQETDPFVLKGAVNEDMRIGREPGDRYRVTGNVLIRNGCTLTIGPGTTVSFAPDTHMRVRGGIVAVGEESHPILFTGDPESPWGKLLIESRSVVTELAFGVLPPEKCDLAYCTIENGEGILMDGAGGRVAKCLIKNNKGSAITIRDAAARIMENQITGNHGGKNGGGIYAYSSLPVQITGNLIQGNQTLGDGGGLFAYGYQANAAIHVAGNRILENQSPGQGGGLLATRASVVGNQIERNRAELEGGGLFATFALVMENRIEKNSGLKGGGIYAETNSTIEKNQIIGNEATDDLGGGAFLNFWGMSVKNESFKLNRVTGNRAADTGGVCLNGSMVFEGNEIFGNEGLQLRNGNAAAEGDFSAPGCYWGGKTPLEIDQAIYDQKDDAKLSRIVYEPFMTTEK